MRKIASDQKLYASRCFVTILARAFPTPYDAAHAFGEMLQSIVSCLIHGKVTILGLQRPQVLCSALLNAGRPAALNVAPRIWLWVAHHYQAIPIAGNPGNGWTVSTTSYYYAYTPSEAQKPEIIAYHWHPDGEEAFRRPHLHIGRAWTADSPRFSSHWHVPTGCVPLGDVLRFAIRELSVVPINREYESVFEEALAQFGDKYSHMLSEPR